MTEQLAALIITAAAHLSLGAFVFSRATDRELKRSFAGLSLTLAAWTFSNGLVTAYAGTPFGVIWARAAFASASLIPVSFLFFVSGFPSAAVRPPASTVIALGVTGCAAFIASLTPLIAKHTSSTDGVLTVAYGPLHPFFGTYVLGCLAHTLYFLANKLRRSKGLERLQVSYVFLGIFLAAVGGTLTNLLIPVLFHSSRFSPYGPVFSLLMVGLIAHSIVRYRLMDIRLVIRRGATYLLSVALVAAAFVVLAWVASSLFASRPPELPIGAQLVFALLIALMFPALKAHIQNLMDRYFFRETHDYQKTLREITRALASTLDLRSLLTLGCEIITKTVRPEFVAVYAADHADTSYRFLLARHSLGVTEQPHAPNVSASLPFISLLSAGPPRVILDELRTPERQPAADDLVRLGAELALAITQDDRLIGFFLLGPKLSADPYFAEEIDLLTTLAGQTSIAIRNAQLYSQIVLANEYVENILANMDSAVIAVSPEGVVMLSNASAEKLTPVTSTRLKGTSLDYLPGAIATPLKLTLSDGHPRWQFETTLVDRQGHLKPIICSTSPLKDRNGAMLGAVVVFTDLTHLKKLEDEKRQAERLASVGALASGVAHEIKNPLVAIKTFAELLPERFADDEFRNDFSQIVTREIERIDDLVARLRGLATHPDRQLGPVDLRAPIEETLALLRGQLEQAQVRVKTEWSPDTPIVAGDHAQLKQLFLNLFLNALEAMRPGGELSIRVNHRRTADGSSLFAEIADTGSGIPESLIGRIFDPFVTTKPNGSGLGLSICRSISDTHRAKIHAENNSSGGTTIVIQFPLLQELSLPV